MMRRSSADQSVTFSGVGFGDAESLFCSKPISEIRNVESNTRKQIEDKKEELRQLIGNRYRDLIDSADSILSMKSFCESISSNILNISDSIFSLSSESPEFSLSTPHTDPNRIKIYGIACRIKYLVDTPENIWGCLDESMFLEAAARYVRAKLVNQSLNLVNSLDSEGAGRILTKNFPLLTHQWQIVDSFRAQITQRSRERLLVMEKNDSQKLPIGAFADALAGVAVIDDLDPKQAFDLFLESRKLWIMQKLNACGSSSADDRGSFDSSAVVSVFVEVTKIIQVTIGQVGELFLQVLSDKPLFYKVILDFPPASQLFGGIPNPDDEVRSWKEFRDKLESVMVILNREFIAQACSAWLRDCGKEIVNEISGRHLIDAIANGEQLASAEKLIREMMDSKDVLKGSLDWLRSIIGSEVELPWSRTRELVLEENVDLWDEIFEDAFIHRMKVIIDSKFGDLTSVVNVKELVTAIGGSTDDYIDFQAYLNRSYSDGGVWFVDPNAKRASLVPSAKSFFEESDFRSCLHAYFGPEVSRIRDAVDNCCQSLLEDLICFLESPKSTMRLKDLAPYLQKKCYDSMSSILMDLKNELEQLHSGLHSVDKDTSLPPTTMVERSLFIGRLLFAFQNHLKHMPVLLGSPRLWANETLISGSKMLPSLLRLSRFSIDSAAHGSPGKHMLTSPRRQTSLVATALFGADDSASPKLEDLNRTMRDLCIMAHGLWISWVSDELAITLSQDLRGDDGLSTLTPLSGWEVISVKQEQSSERESEIKIALPSMPSLYITSFLFKSCQEINQVGGHVLDKNILQQFALRLLEKVITVYGDFITNHEDLVSEKGALQVLLDLKFATDVLSGGDLNATEGVSKSPVTKYAFRRKQEQKTKSAIRERADKLVKRFTERLDPIDWLTYEPYLWENERQSYLRHAILFGFFVQLNRMYTDSMQRLPTNSESNIMRCSTIPRFKYLPISAPALSSRGVTKTPLRTSSDDMSSRSPWRAHTDGDLSQGIDFNSNNSLGVATPFLKSFMQVGNRILTDAQVGRFKDRSAAAMSTFGDILPFQSQSFLSSLTTARTDS